MTSIVAFDLSKRSAGWAAWAEGSQRPIHASKELGTAMTDSGTAFARLHMMMSDIHKLTAFDICYVEEPLQPQAISGHTNFDTLFTLYGLAAHAASFCAAKGVRLRFTNQSNWRRHFIGKMPRATKSAQLKDMAMRRARDLGFKPRNHDEAEAIGILDWACEVERIMPPWRRDEVLRPMLEPVR